jgi:hypothetical protein
MTDLEHVYNMAKASIVDRTDNPTPIGGVEYFYVGAYSGGDDALGGILDKLLDDDFDTSTRGSYELLDDEDDTSASGGNEDDTPIKYHVYSNYDNNDDDSPISTKSICEYGDCPVIIKDDENDSLVVSSEPSTYNTTTETDWAREDGDLIIVKEFVPLEIDESIVKESLSVNQKTEKQKINVQRGGADNIALTPYSRVHYFISDYVKSIGNDKTVKENR